MTDADGLLLTVSREDFELAVEAHIGAIEELRTLASKATTPSHRLFLTQRRARLVAQIREDIASLFASKMIPRGVYLPIELTSSDVRFLRTLKSNMWIAKVDRLLLEDRAKLAELIAQLEFFVPGNEDLLENGEVLDSSGVPETNEKGDQMPEGDETTVVQSTKSVFIVHGHDDAAKHHVARVIERLGLKPIILHEQSNRGMTIIEKIEAHNDVAFAVVLLTPDDVGGRTAEDLAPRARQNVVLELGYFIAKLGRHRVAALVKGRVEKPGDFDGVVYTALDDGGAWETKLAQELRSAGIDVDMNKLAGE